jgi:S-formylglutathione hydrolase FrmB
MPEGNDGWYTDSGVIAADKYESYIIKELLPEIDQKFRTFPERSRRAIAGLSMGGYGSLKFGIKYPEKFVVAGSFSGALMAPALSVKSIKGGWKALEDSITNVYGDDDAPVRKANDIFALLRLLDPQQIKALPFLYLDCGTEDGLIQTNKDFAALLAEKKIPHEYRQRPGKHDWVYWDLQVQEFLRIAARTFPE